jgi:hypothetical protein
MNDFFKHTVNLKELIYILAIASSFLFNYFVQIERIKMLEYRTDKLEENIKIDRVEIWESEKAFATYYEGE